MARLTDRSTIPLKRSDFKVIHGERRLSDVRLAERLGLSNLREIRRLIARWESFLQTQSGKPCHHDTVSLGRGPAGEAYFLTIPELIFIAGKSEARNADVVQYEAAQIAAYWIEGEQAPDDAAPTLRALAAPDRPQLVSIKPETKPPESDLFAVPPPLTVETPSPAVAPSVDDPTPSDDGSALDRWTQNDFHIHRRYKNGRVSAIWFFPTSRGRLGNVVINEDAIAPCNKREWFVPHPHSRSGDVWQVAICFSAKAIPSFEVVEAVYDTLGAGDCAPAAKGMLRHYLS
ncbi:MAG TPA: hypothetical protein VGH47_07345 [Xanthobacteraceae bacterium]|jgi:hypothetical protein